MAWLLFSLFIVVPLLEIFAFIQVGSVIGALPTLALIVLTAAAGVLLVRWQGIKVVLEARRSLARNELPLLAVVHGSLLLLAGLLLLTPGFVTDAAGFLLLIPPVRSLVARRVSDWLRVRTVVRARAYAGPRSRPAVIEGEAVEIDEVSVAPHHSGTPWASRDVNSG